MRRSSWNFIWTCLLLWTLTSTSSGQPSSQPDTELNQTTDQDRNKTESGDNSKSKGHPGKANGTMNSDILCEHYGPWSPWSKCSKRCEMSRKRHCVKGNLCGKNVVLKERKRCKRKRRRKCSKVSYKVIGFKRRTNRLIDQLLYDMLYGSWNKWGPCTRSCKRRRTRMCEMPRICGSSYIQEEKRCHVPSTPCKKRFTIQAEKRTTNEPRKALTTPSPTTSIPSSEKPLVEPVTTEEIHDICGLRPEEAAGSYRVVGGREAREGSWPWQVAIMTRFKEQYCGGTLVAPSWVLTAAHCIRKKQRRRRVIVRVGVHDINAYVPTKLDLKVAKDIPHPRFDYDTISNDIALLKLRRPVRQNDAIGYACLPSPDDEEVKPGTVCYTVGWGKMKNTHIYGVDALREAEVPIVERNRCQKSFDYDISSSQICAGYKQGGVDSCAGDSGGPLMCARKVNGTLRWFIHGVTSYGEGCGEKGKFGIYTNVTTYLPWIYKILKKA